MEIDLTFLQSFIGGTLYFKCSNPEPGLDPFFLLRLKVVDVFSVEYKFIIALPYQPCMLKKGVWAEHKIERPSIFEMRRRVVGHHGKFPKIRLASPGEIHCQLDVSEEIILRHKNERELTEEEASKQFLEK